MASSQTQYAQPANYNITPKTRGDGAPSSLEVDANGNLKIVINGNTGILSAAPLNGQAKIAVTSTAVQLGSNVLLNGVVVSAKSTNAAPIVVGGSGVANTTDGTGNGTILEAGMSMSWAVSNTNALYINGTAGDIVSFSGS
jgi:hypothetical protein